MLRYVHIGDQIEEGAAQFAFYNTVTDSFISLDGCSVFDSVAEFNALAAGHPFYDRAMDLLESNIKHFRRFENRSPGTTDVDK